MQKPIIQPKGLSAKTRGTNQGDGSSGHLVNQENRPPGLPNPLITAI